jgi:glycosyltransferase involved in cell wall biosynthesis
MPPRLNRESDGPRRLVSVIVPGYNGERTIRNTLTSLANQDYDPTEWILVDDGSRDAFLQVIRKYLEDIGRQAKIIQHSRNEGLSRSLNDALEASIGEYVLILHQDIELVGRDWLSKAVGYLESDPAVVVVTCHYGTPAFGELTFVQAAFGFLRQQFHPLPEVAREIVPFTEFKCDLLERSTLDAMGRFPIEFRIAGEDIVVSYQIRQLGGRILKAYDLQAIQRFTGKAETVVGNFQKEFLFGEALGIIARAFGTFPFREMRTSSYARSRSLHRASQPFVAAGLLTSALALIVLGWFAAGLLFALILAIRYGYYFHRLWPNFRSRVHGRTVAAAQTSVASFIGLITDLVYSAGMAWGFVRDGYRAPESLA